MLHKETVSPSTLELLTTLMKDCRLKEGPYILGRY